MSRGNTKGVTMSDETAQEVIIPVEEPVEEPIADSTPAETDKKEESKEEVVVSIEDIVSGAKAKTPDGVQKRIDELTREKYAAKKEADDWRRKAETAAIPSSPTIPAERPLPPAELEFDSTEEFKKARATYEDNLELWRENARVVTSSAAKVRQEEERLAKKFADNANRVAEKYPDFHDVVNQPIFAPQVVRAIFSSEFAPEIGYYLAKNPTVNERINSLDPLSLGREIGKLEIKFGEAKTKFISNAPPPIVPLEGNDTVPKNPSEMEINEWMAWNKQEDLKKIKKKIGG